MSTNSGDGGNGGTASAGPGGTNAASTGAGITPPGTTTGGDPGLGGFGPGLTVGAGPQGAGGGEESCAGETSTAELVPLDLYIMLDSSGSMTEQTATGVSKWAAVKEALTAFLHDPGSAGLGVGLQYFPRTHPGVPERCTSHNQCGEHGPCVLSICARYQDYLCITDHNCPGRDECVPRGQCSVTGTRCAVGRRCPPGAGECQQITESTCYKGESCDPDRYATPAVEIAPINAGTASALLDSIDAKMPAGATPTAGALRGALAHARAHATANPTHKVVTVLATDGLPTLCNPDDAEGIAEIAASGVNGSPSIPTFVIGVFKPGDSEAKETVDIIAEGGGTGSAFFIDTDTDVSQAFLEALNAIRGRSLACEYQVPTPSDGQSLDYGTLNVEHTPPGASEPTTIFYVADEASCDPTAGGWYYDVDPASGGTPTKVVMCPATCATFQAGGEVALRIGCKTAVQPPPR